MRFKHFLFVIIQKQLYCTPAILHKSTLHLIFLQCTLWLLRSEWTTEEWVQPIWSKWFEKKSVEQIEYKKSEKVK